MRRSGVLAVALLLFAAFALQLVLHAGRTSATIDEPTHLLAGYRHLRCGEFTINREHPPLLKMVAAAPLLAMRIDDPLGDCTPKSDAVLFDAAALFVLNNGIDRVIVPARLAATSFALLLALLVFAAAYEWFGAAEALLALAVLAFEPTLIAHGSLITNDMALAATLFASMYALHRYRERPTVARLLLLGLGAGLTLVSKHSGLVVLPLLAVFLWRRVPALLIVVAIAVGVLLLAYRFDVIAYLDGFRVLFSRSERTMYLFDRAYPTGRWFYFPVVFTLKASLLMLVVLPFAIRSRRALLLVPPLAFLSASMLAGLNIGVRHILAIWPFLIVAGAGGLWQLARTRRAAQLVLGALLVFHVASAAVTAPNYIAYANELWGGTGSAHRVLKDSNVDWGQNLKIADEFLARERLSGDCWFAAYGHALLTAAQQPCRLLPIFGWTALRVPDAVPPQLEGTILLSATALPPRGGPEYAPITSTEPVAILGGSVLVYRGSYRVPLLSAVMHSARAIQLLQRGRNDEAVREAEIAYALAPEDPRVRRTMTTIRARTKPAR